MENATVNRTPNDFGFFSSFGNEAVLEMLERLTAEGPIEWMTVQEELSRLEENLRELKIIEPDESAEVLDVIDWLSARDRLID